MKLRNSIIAIFMCSSSLLSSCPMTIVNDSEDELVVVDPYNHQMLVLKKGKSGDIDPSIPGLWYYFYSEKLDFYFPLEGKPGDLYRKYELVEKYCVDEQTKLSFTDIEKLAAKPTDRFTVNQFTKPSPHKTHTHNH